MRVTAVLCLAVLGVTLPLAARASTETTLRIEMREFRFLPATIRLTFGRPVTLRFVNSGQLAHQFDARYLRGLPIAVSDESTRVEAQGLDFLRLQPGGTASLQFLPRRPGRFAFACTIEGHREAGMTGIILIVR
ncbi:MAG TPA: cupredoxin domain-containing protein [bacterium]|jgi:uncharacterized cupredoxin-like copper-binding protein|nr:cupredoxin domain-containing protein [bacterium]